MASPVELMSLSAQFDLPIHYSGFGSASVMHGPLLQSVLLLSQTPALDKESKLLYGNALCTSQISRDSRCHPRRNLPSAAFRRSPTGFNVLSLRMLTKWRGPALHPAILSQSLAIRGLGIGVQNRGTRHQGTLSRCCFDWTIGMWGWDETLAASHCFRRSLISCFDRVIVFRKAPCFCAMEAPVGSSSLVYFCISYRSQFL